MLTRSQKRPTSPRLRKGTTAASSAIFGAVATLALFLSVAHFGHKTMNEPTVETEDLRVYAAIDPPPPPPTETTQDETPDLNLTGFDIAPSDSSVKITVLPPDLEKLLPPPPMAPPAKIELNKLYTEFKPKTSVGRFDQHIYQMSDVDQLPYVLNHVVPDLSHDLLRNLESLHVVVLAVIELDGTPQNLRIARSSGNDEFDRLMMESIAQWTFAPAIRKGKKVRCLISQDTHFKKPSRSLLHLQ